VLLATSVNTIRILVVREVWVKSFANSVEDELVEDLGQVAKEADATVVATVIEIAFLVERNLRCTEHRGGDVAGMEHLVEDGKDGSKAVMAFEDFDVDVVWASGLVVAHGLANCIKFGLAKSAGIP
jgi:hypothetical protein